MITDLVPGMVRLTSDEKPSFHSPDENSVLKLYQLRYVLRYVLGNICNIHVDQSKEEQEVFNII